MIETAAALLELVSAVVKWFKHLTMKWRLVLVATLLILTLAVAFGPALGRGVRVMSAMPSEIPLSGDATSSLNASISSLRTSLDVELSQNFISYYALITNATKSTTPVRIEEHYLHAWSFAQALVAMTGDWPIPPDKVLPLFSFREGPVCRCWRQWPRLDSPEHIAVTAWVVLAMARIGVRPPKENIAFLLNSQNENGWWPIYANNSLPANACTYATALTLLALRETEAHGLLEDSDRNQVTVVVTNGTRWLLSTRLDNHARWLDYPYGDGARVSMSTSGLVMHALHEVMSRKFPTDLDRTWLREMPEVVPKPTDCEAPARFVKDVDGLWKYDTTRYYLLPWLIVGTVDAYPNGSFPERVGALAWLDKAVENTEVTGVLQFDWIAAELLIALRHIKHESL